MDSQSAGSVLTFKEELGTFLKAYQESFDAEVDDNFIQGWILADIVRSSERFLNNLYILSPEEVELSSFPVFPDSNWLADAKTPEAVQTYLKEYIEALQRYMRILSDTRLEVTDESIQAALLDFKKPE